MQALATHIQHVHADGVGAEHGRADPGASELNEDGGGGYDVDDGASAVTDRSDSDPSSSSSSSSSRSSDLPSSASSRSSGGAGGSDGSDSGSDESSSSSSSLSEQQGDQDLMPGPLEQQDRSDDESDDANSSDECVYSVDEEAFPDIDQRITR